MQKSYLTAFAASAYFEGINEVQTGQLMTLQPRLKVAYVPPSIFIFENHSWIELTKCCRPIAAHALAGIFLFLALVGGGLMWSHKKARKNLVLASEPGSIAAAIQLGGASELGYLIDVRNLPFPSRSRAERTPLMNF